ncbi:MAG: T9SS type A sorting domain-containing protein [Flavobacteriales bacterium]|nr:T9SS type A sorting domain-containing protein [Flavobacteriales bacterium]
MNSHKVVHAALVLLLHGPDALWAQGLNNLWMGGTNSEEPIPFGGTDLDFGTGTVEVSYVQRDIGFRRTSTNITNSNGVLLFSTNGSFIANATGDTMLNGAGLNPSEYTSSWPGGFHISQACLILPKPGAPGIYYLIHGTIDEQQTSLAHYLYLTTIDMSLDGGLGGVVSKNQVLISDTLNAGRITAVRHANGRDWWVFCHKVDTNMFHRLLVTPTGVNVEGTQSMGIIRPRDHGQVCFSPDGSKFAYYWGQFNQDLEIFDYDRCTGLFSNPVQILIDDANSMGGVAFSPNSRYLYVSSVEDVYQYDTEATDIAASMVHIAEWDGFYSPSPPFATLFDIAQLAPDGKIYIATGNSSLHLHVINDPDQPGMACDIVQHQQELPTYYTNSLPNHPNYHLGPVDGSVCDSLGINNGAAEAALSLSVAAYPNPSNGAFTLSYPVQSVVGELEVRDLSGRLVLRERIPQWSQVHRVVLHSEAAGLYQCQMRWGASSIATRIILTEP